MITVRPMWKHVKKWLMPPPLQYGVCKCFPWCLPFHGTSWALLSFASWYCQCAYDRRSNPFQRFGSTGQNGNFPQYGYPHALRRYAEIAEALNLGGENDHEKLENLIKAINDLKARVGSSHQSKYGINEKEFLERLDEMVEQAFDDQCTGTNPRYPLMSEIRQMYLNTYYGKKHFVDEEKPNEADIAGTEDENKVKGVSESQSRSKRA